MGWLFYFRWQWEGRELPGYVHYQGRRAGFHLCPQTPSSLRLQGGWSLLRAWSCFWGSILIPEPGLNFLFLSGTRKVYCVIDQLRGNYANQSNHLVQLRNLNVTLPTSFTPTSYWYAERIFLWPKKSLGLVNARFLKAV